VTSRRTASHQGRAYSREEIELRMREALTSLMADGTPVRDVSVERLLTAGGVARSTFYRHFDDKAGLLRALEAGSLKRLYSAQRSWIDLGLDAGRADILASMRQLLDAYLENEVIMRAVVEASVYEPAVREDYLSGVHDYARAMERLIKQLHAKGRRTHLSARATSRSLAWMTERTVHLATPGASPKELDSIAGALTDIIWATLFEGD
jgi:AcrR family transcriptional regulator